MNTPLRYDSSMEIAEEDDVETTAGLIETMQKITAITTRDYGRGVRSVHAKCHGLLIGKMTVIDGLPPHLAQGLFARAGAYDVVLRISTIPGDILDDNVSTPRGMAVKVIGVDGERLAGSAGDVTQDFVMVNGPAFLKSNAKDFLGSAKLLAATTDKGKGLKKAFSTIARGTEKLLESVGGQSGTLIAMGGQAETNVLGETYYSQAPVLYGDYVCKIGLFPVSPSLTALTKAPVDLKDKPDGLRGAVIDHFAAHAGEWELRVQLCTDLETMPIEDASVVWPEETSPYVAVARIMVAPQSAWNSTRQAALDEGLSFSPWHGIAAHRPLGSIMRVRKAVYETMAAERMKTNGKPGGEPVSLASLGVD